MYNVHNSLFNLIFDIYNRFVLTSDQHAAVDIEARYSGSEFLLIATAGTVIGDRGGIDTVVVGTAFVRILDAAVRRVTAVKTAATAIVVVVTFGNRIFVVIVVVTTVQQQQSHRSLPFPVQNAGQQPAATAATAPLGFGPELTAQPLHASSPIVRRRCSFQQ